jgi:site-specific recombinase XerD
MTTLEIVPPAKAPALAIMPRQLPADRHPAHVYIARLGSGSRRTMSEALDVIAGILTNGQGNLQRMPWAALRYQHTAAVRAALMEKYKPSTANKMLAALRGVLKESWRLGYITAEDYHRAADVPTIKAQTLPRGRALASGEISALMGACGRDSSPAGIRDASLIAVLYGAGLRRSESVGLDLSDYNVETGELVIRGAKGRKDRLGYATNGSADALKDWLVARGGDPGPLFCRINKGGRITIRRLTDQAVLHVLKKRAVQASVASFSPHDLRRSFISDLLDAGADISTAQQLAGHANVQTTARYDRRGEATKRKAAELLHVPYLRRKAKR